MLTAFQASAHVGRTADTDQAATQHPLFTDTADHEVELALPTQVVLPLFGVGLVEHESQHRILQDT